MANFTFHQSHLGSNPNGISVNFNTVLYVAIALPNPAYGDTIVVLNTPTPDGSGSPCMAQTDSTTWVYTYNGTRSLWHSDMHYWNGNKANTLTEEYGIILNYSYNATGIAQDPIAAKIALYPNPTTNVINVSNIGRDAKVNMYNAIGQEVYSTVATDHFTINTVGMEKGMYFVKVNQNVFKVVVK